ncbi:MAG: DUF1993 domain-containing protein [Pseudanabaenaceae cyanobacterium]
MSVVATTKHIFLSRLDTLNHLIEIGANHFADDPAGLLARRLAPDMFPFGAQIVLTCNQPRNFALWCKGENHPNPSLELPSLTAAKETIAQTKELVHSIPEDDGLLAQSKRMDFGQGLYLELTGRDYINEFLIPNFYFHLMAVYAILRMAGAPVGKRDYMIHLMPLMQKAE